MNPTAEPTPATSRTEADGPLVVALATDPARPPVPFDATLRHPARFAAALGVFLRTIAPDPSPLVAASRRDRPGPDSPSAYRHARRACALDLIAENSDLGPSLVVSPIVTVAGDAWIAEGFAADQSVYARLCVPSAGFAGEPHFPPGTTSFSVPPSLPGRLESIEGGMPIRVLMTGSTAAVPVDRGIGPPGWLRGFLGVQAALSLPARRVAVDRGGLFGLIGALGESRRVRASRSVVVRWEPGQPAQVVVRAGARAVPLHVRVVGDGPAGTVRVAVGHALRGLAGLLHRVDSADLFLLGPGLPSFWSVRLGGVQLLLGIPGWTADGRLGSLSLDPVLPPVEPGRFLANQVVATFRNHPAQTREQVVERTRGSVPEVSAVLTRLAGLGQIMPDPATGVFRWRPAFDDADAFLDDPEPAEVTAARGIARTAAVRITRDAVEPGGQGRVVEGLILDRPVAITLDPDGWIRRGRCTCSHHSARGVAGIGPCRHLLALQAQAAPGPRPEPPDLAAWFAGFPAPPTPA